MKKSGYIKLFRTIEDWEWVDNPTMFYFGCRILLMANWEDKEWHGQVIERGSFITTLSRLSDALHLSVQQVRTCLANMQSNKQITCTSTNKATKITICKYDDYQGVQQAEQQTENAESNKPTTQTKEGSEYSDSYESSYSSQEDKNINNNISIPCASAQAREESHPPTPFQFRTAIIDLGVEPKVTDDWLKVRKAKKGINTETAFRAIEREVKKAIDAGYTANACIILAAEKSWVGFKFEWALKEWTGRPQSQPQQQSRIEQFIQTSQNFNAFVNEIIGPNVPGAGYGPANSPDEQ